MVMDDWFDINNSILSVGDNERKASLAECRLSVPGPLAALRNQLSGMSTPVRNKTNSIYDTPYASLRRKSFGSPSVTVQHTPSAGLRRMSFGTPSVTVQRTPSTLLRRMSFGTPSVRFEDSLTLNTPLSAINASSSYQDSELESFNFTFHNETPSNDSTFLTSTKKATSTPVSNIDHTFNMNKFVAPDATFTPKRHSLNPGNATFSLTKPSHNPNASINLYTPVNSRSVMNLLGQSKDHRPKPVCLNKDMLQ